MIPLHKVLLLFAAAVFSLIRVQPAIMFDAGHSIKPYGSNRGQTLLTFPMACILLAVGIHVWVAQNHT